MTNDEYIKGLLSLGYKDYIASRFLINNNYILQGTVLASSAVEKYLKAVLAGLGKKITKYHLDNLGKFKSLFRDTPYSMMFDILDPVFLEILGKAYRYRYYDDNTITKPDTIGFMVNQFLGTLDFTILKLDSLIIQSEVIDGVVTNLDSQLKRASKSGLPDLLFNNYVLNGINKEEFMKRMSRAYGLHISPLHFGIELEISGENIACTYEGQIMSIVVDS